MQGVKKGPPSWENVDTRHGKDAKKYFTRKLLTRVGLEWDKLKTRGQID